MTLRVLLVAQQLRRSTPGGIGTYLRGLVAGLAAGGATDVSLLASRSPSGTGDDPLTRLGPPVLASALPAALLTRAWHAGLVGAPPGFAVVHAASLAAPRSPAAPLTVAVHDMAWRVVPETFPARGRRWHDAALAHALTRASMLLAPTSRTADELLAAGARPDQIEVVDPMYGCDHLPAADLTAAANRLGQLGVTGHYLLAVGTLEPRKNLSRLVQAYTRARPSLPEPWPLVVVGPPGWGEALAGPLPEGVVLAGPVPGAVLAGLYEGARAVAYVPLHEGFGLPAVEAMAAGAPVVATPMPSTGGAALEVDPHDVAAMGHALVEVLTDEFRRSELIEAGAARAAELTWAAAAARHVELWNRLA